MQFGLRFGVMFTGVRSPNWTIVVPFEGSVGVASQTRREKTVPIGLRPDLAHTGRKTQKDSNQIQSKNSI